MDVKRTNFRWIVVALLFVITVINYLDRASVSYAIGSIATEYHFSQTNIGLILGSFGIGYMVTTFLGGLGADYFGAKRMLLYATLLWSLATFLFPISFGFSMFFMARVLLGLAEGPNFPGLTRAISDWLSLRERTRAFSYALISVPFALAISGPIITSLIASFSWRGCYYILTALSLAWIPLWCWLFHDKPADSPYVNHEENKYIQQVSEEKTVVSKTTWRTLLSHKTLLANYWSFFVFGFFLFFFMTWLPNYLENTYHMNLKSIGWYTSFPWLLAMLLMWVSGTLADKVFKHTGKFRLSRTYPIMISQLLSAFSLIPLFHPQSLMNAMICISLAIGFTMSSNASFYAVNVDVAKDKAGTSLGIMDALFALAGFIAPTLTGYMVTWTGHYESVFFLLAVLAMVSFIVTFCFHNK